MSVTLTPDIERIKKWLESVVNDPEARRKLLTLGTLELSDRVRVYPTEGLYNFEPGAQGNGVWYQRQFGSRWRRKTDGRLGGHNTSERLQKNWKVSIAPDAFSASVYTSVTYAPYLYDPQQRVHWAESHGWQTIDQIAEDYAPRFQALVEEYIDDQLSRPI